MSAPTPLYEPSWHFTRCAGRLLPGQDERAARAMDEFTAGFTEIGYSWGRKRQGKINPGALRMAPGGGFR
jgi:hypothetical protein